MNLTELFTTEELKNKVYDLYDAVRCGIRFEEKFEEVFGVQYQLFFGEMNAEDCMFLLLQNHYQNEYYVKKTFEEKCLKNRSNAFEFPVCDSRADIVSVGKKLQCYEIKTQYDTLDRLSKQIKDYSRVFEYVNVVCSEDKVEKVKELLPEYCGIISYKNRKNAAFVQYREADISPYLESESILACLRYNELKKCFGTTERKHIAEHYETSLIERQFKICLQNRFEMN